MEHFNFVCVGLSQICLFLCAILKLAEPSINTHFSIFVHFNFGLPIKDCIFNNFQIIFPNNPKMHPNTRTYELLFSTYNGVYPCWPFLGLAICLSFIGFVGMFLNFCVIYVTIKSKSLRSTANYLLAITSLFEFLHQHGHFIILFTSISGLNFLPLSLAVRLSTISLFGIFGIAPLMLFTGIDRLLCVTFPIFYKSMPRSLYLGAILCITSSFSLALVAIQFHTSNEFGQLQVPGVIGDLLQGFGGEIYVKISFSLNALTVAIYLLVGALIRRQCDPNSCTRDQNFSRRIFRTLLTLISLNMGGYLLIFAYYAFIFAHFGGGTLAAWFLEQFFGVLVNISAASSALVLYLTSTDYRKAFRSDFAWAFRLLNWRQIGRIISVHPNEQLKIVKKSIISVMSPRNSQIPPVQRAK